MTLIASVTLCTTGVSLVGWPKSIFFPLHWPLWLVLYDVRLWKDGLDWPLPITPLLLQQPWEEGAGWSLSDGPLEGRSAKSKSVSNRLSEFTFHSPGLNPTHPFLTSAEETWDLSRVST